jgi:hypothetical protein
MPKRLSKPKEISQLAQELVRRSTDTDSPKVARRKRLTVTPADISRVMAAMGQRGGKIGGKRRMVTMTREQRSEIAKKGAVARWAKKKPHGN